MHKGKIRDNYIFRILIFFLVLISTGIVFRHFYYPKATNSERLSIATPYGDEQAYHPKVIAFDGEWNGYKYWMAYTPYPAGNEAYENPCVSASNDRVTWTAPAGLNNPLDTPANADKEHYNSDTHILYNPDTARLEVFWRYVDNENNTLTIFKSDSADGVHWSAREVFLYSANRSELDYVSPAICYQDGIYRIWYVNEQDVWYMEKTGERTGEPVKMQITYANGYKSWHIDVMYNADKQLYEMIAVAYENGTKRKTMDLYYTSSPDNSTWSTPVMILQPATDNSAWDNQGLYRASLLYENGTYYVYYGAHDKKMNVGVGLMYGQDITALEPYAS